MYKKKIVGFFTSRSHKLDNKEHMKITRREILKPHVLLGPKDEMFANPSLPQLVHQSGFQLTVQTNTKVITLAKHKEHRISRKPFKTGNKYK